jgi:hypothetical protein
MNKEMLDSLTLMTAKDGAQSILTAALSLEAKGGQYWGPNGFDEQRGEPGLAKIYPSALDESLNEKLWE